LTVLITQDYGLSDLGLGNWSKLMKTILVPTDFSQYANHASDFAAQLAIQYGAELCFIHVVEIPGNQDSEYYLNHLLVQNMMKEAEKNLQETSKKYENVKDVKTFVTTSNAVSGIKNGILSMDADFIVMGKHSHFSVISDLLFDNNTEKIIRYADCPVFSISRPVDSSKWRKSVIAVDPESIHEDLLYGISALTESLGLTPHFVWVAKNHETHTINNIEYLKDALRSHFQSKTFLFSSTVNNDAATGIVALADELHADLIMLGTHARSGFNRMIHGSVTEKVVDSSEIPTLVVRLDDYQGFPVIPIAQSSNE
jgi:nucleotide-binding universal stress UspA family protein